MAEMLVNTDNNPESDFFEDDEFDRQANEQPFDADDGDCDPPDASYTTLATAGSQRSIGSKDHHDDLDITGCTPCTFFCFTRRGCNRGLECRFCHLAHQSKLQQRRESWKKQQREKRKSIRERQAAEAIRRRATGDKKPVVPKAVQPVPPPMPPAAQAAMPQLDSSRVPRAMDGGARNFELFDGGGRGEAPMSQMRRPMMQQRPVQQQQQQVETAWSFSYKPSSAILTIGQHMDFRPQLSVPPSSIQFFRLTAHLPRGLILDPVSGSIAGVPVAACPRTSIVVEAELQGGHVLDTTLEIEVIDFTREGFAVGHLSEVEPGKFMLLLYIPNEDGSQGAPVGGAPCGAPMGGPMASFGKAPNIADQGGMFADSPNTGKQMPLMHAPNHGMEPGFRQDWSHGRALDPQNDRPGPTSGFGQPGPQLGHFSDAGPAAPQPFWSSLPER